MPWPTLAWLTDDGRVEKEGVFLSFGRFEEVNDSTSALACHRIFCSRSKHGQATRGRAQGGPLQYKITEHSIQLALGHLQVVLVSPGARSGDHIW